MILILSACSKRDGNDLYTDHLDYFDLIGIEDYFDYELIIIVDSQGCKSCWDSALPIIHSLESKHKIKIVDLGIDKKTLYGQNLFLDSSRLYFSFPFSFDGMTVVDFNSKEVYYPLFESTPISL